MTTTTQKKTTTTKAKTATTETKKVVAETVPDLPTNPFIFEILNVVSKMRSKANKVEALQKFNTPALKTILIWNFDESVVSMLPPGDVPYASVGEQHSLSGTVSE